MLNSAMCYRIVKVKSYSSDKFLMEIHLRTTGCRLPYGITHYLPPDTSEHTPLNPSQ